MAEFDGEIFKEMDKHSLNGLLYSMYNFGKYNLAAFTTCLGDGCYATYIGFDGAGKPSSLVTEFEAYRFRSRLMNGPLRTNKILESKLLL